MRPVYLSALSVLLVGVMATPALAARERVNAAENVTRYESIGEFCDVFVDDFSDFEVNVYCFDTGRTWFKVRVPGVTGRVTRVIARGTGDCSGKRLSFRKRGDVAIVKVTNVGEFDCSYSTIIVRHTG